MHIYYFNLFIFENCILMLSGDFENISLNFPLKFSILPSSLILILASRVYIWFYISQFQASTENKLSILKTNSCLISHLVVGKIIFTVVDKEELISLKELYAGQPDSYIGKIPSIPSSMFVKSEQGKFILGGFFRIIFIIAHSV